MSLRVLSPQETTDDVRKDQQMQHDVVHVRHKARIALSENAHRPPEAVVVTLQLPLARAEDRVIPVAPELHRRPEKQHPEQGPPPHREIRVVRDQSRAVEAQCEELRTLDALPFHEKDFPETISRRAAEEPDPQQRLDDNNQYIYSWFDFTEKQWLQTQNTLYIIFAKEKSPWPLQELSSYIQSHDRELFLITSSFFCFV